MGLRQDPVVRPTPGDAVEERAGARVLGDDEVRAALALCALDPVASVLATTRLEQAAQTGLRGTGGQVWGYGDVGALRAVCWVGANLVPVVPPGAEDTLHAFAALARAQGRRCSSIVGDAAPVLALWELLSGYWPAPREVRADQPSFVIDHDPLVEPDRLVRRSVLTEYELLLPACVQMFVEEVGYSPVSGVGGPYEARVHSLIADGRSFARIEQATPDPDRRPGSPVPEPEVVFKAELGAVAGGVAQVQGVWVTPARRGERLSEGGMAAVVAATRAEIAPVVSLYANHYNTRAIAAYRAVGFRQQGTYATVLF
ncbi:GNAT family N-acetyltransferase [Cellulomonas hominis]